MDFGWFCNITQRTQNNGTNHLGRSSHKLQRYIRERVEIETHLQISTQDANIVYKTIPNPPTLTVSRVESNKSVNYKLSFIRVDEESMNLLIEIPLKEFLLSVLIISLALVINLFQILRFIRPCWSGLRNLN